MAGIKISDLPPNALPLAGTEQMELENADGNSTKATVADVAAAASGLDATFLTVAPNAILPNERVLTAGTNVAFVDTGPNGTLTINVASVSFPLLAPDGAVGAPSYSFASDPDSGVFLVGADILGFTAGGVLLAQVVEVVGANQFIVSPGVVQNNPLFPSIALGDGDSGFFESADDVVVIAIAGVNRWEYNGNQFRSSQFSGGPALVAANTSASDPTVLPHQARTGSGLASGAANQVELVADGETGVSYRTLSGEVTVTNSFEDGIVASTTQTQFQGQLNSSYSEVITVANPNDVVTAPQRRRGMQLVIVNRGANVLQVFPANNDDLGNGTNNSITIAAGESLIAVGGAGPLGQSWDVLFNGPSSGGDVIKVGTPVDNQVGVWTGDGTIEGTANFTYDTGTKTFGLGAGSTFFTGSSTYFFQDGNLSLDGQSTDTPILSIVQSGINNFSLALQPSGLTLGGGVPIGEFNVSGNVVRWTFDNVPVRIQNSAGTDWIQQSHDGTDYNFAAVNTADINFTGISGRIMQDAETLAFVSEIISPDPLLLSSGGVGVPTYSFAVDTDTGVFNPGPDILGLTAGGVLGLSVTEVAGAITVGILDNLTIDATTGPGPHLSFVNIAPSAVVIDLLPTGSTAYDIFKARDSSDTTFFVLRHDYSLSAPNHFLTFNSQSDNGILEIEVDNFVHMCQRSATFETGIGIGGVVGLQEGGTPAAFAGTGKYWVRSDVPNTPMFTDDAGNEFELNLTIPGTVTDSTLRFDGSEFVEETQVRISAAGILTVFDATLADTFAVAHNGSDVLLTSVGAAKVRFGGDAGTDVTNEVGNFEARSGNALIAFDPTNADFIRISQDGTDTLMANTGSASVLHTGAVTGYKFDNSVYITEQAAANADTAGEGQFWTRDDVPNIPMFTNDVGIDFKLGVANDAVQARRTTSFTITTAFTDVTLDTTDIETDPAIIEHSGTTDRIEALVAGTYEITYGADIDPSAAGNDNIRAFGRVRLNDAGVDLPGSLASTSAYEDASTIGNQVFGRLQCSFIVVLAISDFVTLQLMKVEIGGTGTFTAEEVTVTAKRLL